MGSHQDSTSSSLVEDTVSASISLLFCPFDLYFLGTGIGVRIIAGGSIEAE